MSTGRADQSSVLQRPGPAGPLFLAGVASAVFLALAGVCAALLSIALFAWPARLAAVFPSFSPVVMALQDAGLEAEALRAAIAADPSNARLVSLLAASELNANATDRAGRLTAIAARLSKHETSAHFRLFLDDLAEDDGASAVVRLDTLLRTDPRALRAIMGAVSLRGWPPAFVRELAGALAKRPPWRLPLVYWLMQQEPSLNAAVRVVQALAKTGMPLKTTDISSLLSRLVAGNRAEAARGLWLESLTPDRRDKVGTLFDPRFETDPLGGPFEWTPGIDPGVTVAFEPDLAIPGRAAVIDVFAGQRPNPLLSQMVMLEPGRWRFSGRVRLQRVDAARGLRWSAICVGGPALGGGEALTGDVPWQEVSFEFEVGGENCRTQWLFFGVYALNPLDARFSGQVRLGDHNLVAVP